MLLRFCRFHVNCQLCRCHCHFLGEKCSDEDFISTIPPPPGGTAILPEYIHYYGYYYQVIVQCLST
jgi:hypothetical protein